ncbi:Retrovirus-related Pol polyprotein from transposon RE1 [Vitis vinifera]|uniref:Retrovirus-related Pol polyprotein from transposon RE1 n=1 Tax=Vitis vinifera TaxID=29760 RepID=A0A438F8X7_VITVI|nr:Retrovirus-related Pol polyprotein from transposon RE1 [Vitis vinifera]
MKKAYKGLKVITHLASWEWLHEDIHPKRGRPLIYPPYKVNASILRWTEELLSASITDDHPHFVSIHQGVTCMVVRTLSLYIYISQFRVLNSGESSSDRVSLRSPHSLPEPLRTTLFGEFFRRPLFRAPTTYSEPPEADLHASGNPTGNQSLTRPHAPIFPVGLSLTRRRVTARFTFRPRPTPLQARPAPSWPSSPPQSSTSPASPLFFLFLAFLPFRPHLTGLPLHLRGLGAASLPLQGSLRSKYVNMTTKNQIFTSVLSGSPLITLEKLVGSENYLSWSASVELWFMGQGYEDHLVTQEADIPEVDRRTVEEDRCPAKGLYTNDIQRLYKVASAIVHLNQQDLDLSTYIGQIASLKEQFLTVMPLTPDVGAQQTQLDNSSLDDVFARLLRLSSTQTLPSDSASDSSVLVSQTTSRGGRNGTRGRGQRPHCTYCNKLGHTRDRCYQLHGRPPRTAHMAQSSDSPLPQLPSSSASQTSQASIASVAQPGNASACLTHTSSLGPWILDSGASDHLSGNKDLFSSITTTSDLPTVTLANGSQTVAKGIGLALPLPSLPLTSDRSTGKTIGIGRESQGLYHLTSDSSPAVCISTDAPLHIHYRLGHPSLSKFQKMVPRFSTLSSLPCLSSSPRIVAPLPFPEAPADSLPIPSASPAPALPSPNDLPIAVRKVGCRWVYAVKVGPDGQVDRLKARLVAKGYTQVYGSDYGDTFSPVAKIASVRLLLSMAAMCSWPLYQLDIKNASLHGDLAEEVYMEQPPGFVAQGESGLVCRLRRSLYGLKQSPRAWFSRFSSVVQEFGMLRSTADHSVFYHHNSLGQCIYLVVYVDDIVITGSDQDGIQKLKQHLFTHFQTKDLGKLKYFLGIEIAQSSSGVVLSQRKYALDILEETGMLDCKPVDTPMDPNVKLVLGQGEPLGDPGRYRRLVGKLNYLTITRPDISFPVSVVSQFLQSPCDSHWDAVIRILRYIKSTPGQGVLYENRGHTQVVGYTDADWAGSPTDRRSTSGYCVFIGGNLISWKSKKQDVVARSSAEAEYRAMALATCELIWLRHLLQELRFGKDEQMKLICDNQAALHIASNPVFHERTKHIEVDCHFIREKIASGCVATSFVNSNDQLADIFTKSLRGPRIKYICNKLGAYDVYAPA